jgi:hypothetical protein
MKYHVNEASVVYKDVLKVQPCMVRAINFMKPKPLSRASRELHVNVS